jgi:hypothetical protein
MTSTCRKVNAGGLGERIGTEVADVDQVLAVLVGSQMISQPSLRSRTVMPIGRAEGSLSAPFVARVFLQPIQGIVDGVEEPGEPARSSAMGVPRLRVELDRGLRLARRGRGRLRSG